MRDTVDVAAHRTMVVTAEPTIMTEQGMDGVGCTLFGQPHCLQTDVEPPLVDDCHGHDDNRSLDVYLCVHTTIHIE